MDYLITPSLLSAYIVCKRQAWLMSRNIGSDQDNPYLELGRMINDEFYKRQRKEIVIDNMKIDLLENSYDNLLIVGEIKKSSNAAESSKYQLLFYLYNLKKLGIKAQGMLLFPTERRREKIYLTKEYEKEIESLIEELKRFLLLEKPPKAIKIHRCSYCSYKEFCWS